MATQQFKVSKGTSQNEKVISWHLVEDVLGLGCCTDSWHCVVFQKRAMARSGIVTWDIALYSLERVQKSQINHSDFPSSSPRRYSLDELKAKICELRKVDSSPSHAYLGRLRENIMCLRFM